MQFGQGGVQQVTVVGKILHHLARGGVDGRPVGRGQLVDVPRGRIAGAHQIAELRVNVVEQVGDETVRQVGRDGRFRNPTG